METFNFSSGATFFPTPTPASEAAISAIREHKTYYGATEGMPALRQAIADRYQKLNQATVEPGNILVTPGAKQALYLALKAILKPGDEVIVPVPNWPGLHQVLEVLEARLVPMPTFEKENYTLHPEALRNLIKPRTRAFLLSNPCNPTGRIYTKSEIKPLVQVITGFPNLYFISDEIYDLVSFGDPVPSLIEFPDQNQQHLVVNGFSKSFAMTGWRVGYIIAPPGLIEKCTRFQHIIYGNVSEFSQEAAVQVLENLENILPAQNQMLEKNRTVMAEFFRSHKIPFTLPSAAYYFFPDLSQFLSETLPDAIVLSQFLKEKAGVEILPGDYFGAPGHARISFALDPDKLPPALEALQAGLDLAGKNPR